MRENGGQPAGLGWLPPRWHLALLVAWTVVCAKLSLLGPTAQRVGSGLDWKAFLVPGSRLLYSGSARFSCPGGHFTHLAGGLHLYASYPCLQIGPLAFAVAGPIRFLSPDNGVAAADLIMSAAGLAILLVIWRIMAITRPELLASRAARWTFLIGSGIFMVAWETLAVGDGHLDDVLALLFAALAVLAGVSGRPVLTGLALGLSVDAKPWALIFLPVLLLAAGVGAWRAANLAGRPVRDSLRPCLLAASVALVVIAAGWLPFYLADPAGTAAALHFQIYNAWASGLRVLGVHSAEGPAWVRPVQIALGCLLGAIAVWRGRWPAVLMLGAAARIGLDPATHGYYTPGLLMGAMLWDLVGARRPIPFWTAFAFLALNGLPVLTTHGYLRGDVRLGSVVLMALAVLLAPARWCWQPGPAVTRARGRWQPSAARPHATEAPQSAPVA